MKTTPFAAALFAAASAATFAFAQDAGLKPTEPANPNASATPAPPSAESPDARQFASDADVGAARRTYRASCQRFQSSGFCDCVTAGVAQALAPQEVRIAARSIGSWINAQGDTAGGVDTDATPAGANSAMRIERVQAHYADVCQQFRRG
ncbi:MAG: hypothetical protein JSS00_05005 [Proteobacteria bacterium]|nr:hypothetical protein [Pseudomonadota bacterium]